jgi:hypothetical protein
MLIPQFFAWDNFEYYSDGAIASWGKNVSWSLAGTFEDANVVLSSDNFESYSDGTIAELTAGNDWLANGVFTIY